MGDRAVALRSAQRLSSAAHHLRRGWSSVRQQRPLAQCSDRGPPVADSGGEMVLKPCVLDQQTQQRPYETPAPHAPCPRHVTPARPWTPQGTWGLAEGPGLQAVGTASLWHSRS